MSHGRGTYKHLLALAKKKPHIGELVDKVHDMSDEQIDAVEGVQVWIKKQLRVLKRIKAANDMAALLMKDADYIVIKYPVYKYHGESVAIGSRLLLDVDPGDYIMVISNTELKINSTALKVYEAEASMALSHSEYVDKCDITTYNIDILQPYLREKLGDMNEDF